MADLYLKRGDLGKDIVQVLEAPDGTPLDLTGAGAVALVVRSALTGRRLVGRFSGAIDQSGVSPNIALQGQVRCVLSAALVANAGDYLYEWELTYSGSKPTTVPNNAYGTLRIDDDLG